MDRKSLAGRLSKLVTASREAARPTYFRPQFEPLEQRQLLTADPVYINEVYFDPPGSLDSTREYIELRGAPNQALDNYYLLFLENENSPTANSGVIERYFGFAGEHLGTNGFLTLREKNSPYTVAPGTTDLVNHDHDNIIVDGGWGAPISSLDVHAENDKLIIENSGATVMLIYNASGPVPTIGMDLDVDDSGLDVPTGQVGWEIVDAIGIHLENNESVNGRLYAQINYGFGPSTKIEPGATYIDIVATYNWPEFEAEYIGRWGNSTGHANADWHVSNLSNDGAAGYTGDENYRQSGEPQGVGAPGQIVETTQNVPYGTGLTNTLGAPNYPAAVTGTHLFYKGSTKWDVTNNNLPGFSDDNAIAPDKTAYVANGAAATFANVSNYTRGINGLMVDVSGPHGAITANDFIFKVGNNNSPSTWATATAPITVTTRSGAGSGGSDRVEIMWANNAIQKQWLEVVVRGNDALGGSNTNTVLNSSYVFFYGSAPGDSGSGDVSGFLVNATDETSARNDPHGTTNPATITNVNDFDRNGLVNSTDQGATRTFSTSAATQLKFLTVGAGGPFAPASSAPAGDNGIASALAAASSVSATPSTSPAPALSAAPAQSPAPLTGSTAPALVSDARDAVFAEHGEDDDESGGQGLGAGD